MMHLDVQQKSESSVQPAFGLGYHALKSWPLPAGVERQYKTLGAGRGDTFLMERPGYASCCHGTLIIVLDL